MRNIDRVLAAVRPDGGFDIDLVADPRTCGRCGKVTDDGGFKFCADCGNVLPDAVYT